MTQHRGPGWWKQPIRHKRAAIEGWRGRRRGRTGAKTPRRPARTSMTGWPGHKKAHSEASQRAWIERSTPKEVVARERARDEDARTEKAIKMDRSKQAKTVYHPNDADDVMKWKDNKSHSDLAGVDTLFRRLTRIKRKAAVKVKVTRVKRKQIVKETEEKVKKIAKDPEKPKEAKKREIKKVIEESEKKIEVEHKEAIQVIQKAKEDQTVEVTRHQHKWTRERRKRAEYVSETTGCSVIEADGLIQRAKSAGRDYDTVDWDRVQGKDLTYHERVNKLDETVGRQTATKAERRTALRSTDWIIDQYEKDEENWQMEIQGAMRDLAFEEERIYQTQTS